MLKSGNKHHVWNLCASVLWMTLAAIPVFSQAQTPDINLTVYRDLVRFAVQGEAQAWRVEVFGPSGEKLFDSDFVSGQSLDWPLSGQSGQLPASGLYAYTITIKDASGNVSGTQRGNVIIDPARENLEPAPPLNPWSAERLMRKWDGNQGVKAHTGSAEMFLYQDRHHGLLGTASAHPLNAAIN